MVLILISPQRFDDVYLTGLVGTEELGLNPTNIHGIYEDDDDDVDGTAHQICHRKNVMISGYGEGGDQLLTNWNQINA